MPNPLGGFDYTWPLYLGGVLAYLIGSIPFGLLLVRFAGLGDVRELGSGNIGATNVLRTGNKGLAAATLLLDGGKGVVAVLVANYFGPDMAVVAGGAVVVGHVFPVWLRFRGGKGVATALGTILAIAWPVGVLACAVWVLAAKFWRYSSLAGILAVTASPLFGWYLADPQRSELMFFLAVVVVVRHHANLRRLFKGEESKISLAKGEPGQRAGDPRTGRRDGRFRFPEFAGMSGSARALSDSERRDWIRLIGTENVGPITFFELLRRYGSTAEALRAVPALSTRGGRNKALRIPTAAAAEDAISAHERLGAAVVACGEADYPPLLAQIADPPPILSVRGHAHLLRRPAVAVVGARNASAAGGRFARQIAAEFGSHDYVVVSGLARGIDSNAHAGALEHGTVAVVAGGVDIVYPPENKDLMARIVDAGVVIGEQPLGTVPMGRHFPRRNRIIAGSSRGVVVVEARSRSGSLITALYAADQGRDVFAVPGSPLDPRTRGSNELLRQGAVLTESAADVVAALESAFRRPLDEVPAAAFGAKPPSPPDDAEIAAARRSVTNSLSSTPVSVDEIIRQCQLTPAAALTVLLELDLAGRVERQSGNKISLKTHETSHQG